MRMEGSERPSSEADSVALDVWLDFLRLADPADNARFEELCKQRPDLDLELRELRLRTREVRGPVGQESAIQARLKSISRPINRGSRFQRKGVIARGGMGVIYRVQDLELERPLALKEMTPASTGNHDLAAARFLEEAQITAQLDHPGIVPVHEVGQDADGHLYFAMKLVQGRDMKAILDLVREGRDGWNQTRALGVILRVCEAMAYAHAKGVIHRDLKPSNVMVGRFGEVYVMDWGLARALARAELHDLRIKGRPETVSLQTARKQARDSDFDSPLLTMDGIVIGTPCYMAPEQARGELDQISPRSDVYSIGAILYHVLTGEPPYVPRGSTLSPSKVLWRVIEGPPKPVTEFDPRIRPELVAIQQKAMARNPSDRYGDTGELAADLRAFLEQRVVSAYETGALAELAKWTQRNRALATALSSIVIVLAVSLVLSLALKRRSDKNEILAKERQTLAERQKDDLSRLSALQRLDDLESATDRLWPLDPEKLGAFDTWISEANNLIAELEPGEDEHYQGHRSKLRELEARGRPPTKEECEESRTNPSYRKLAEARVARARARQARDSRANPSSSPLPLPDLATLPDKAPQLCALAWPLVDPDRKEFGEEQRGLALAECAMDRVQDEGEAPRANEVFAWALFANGAEEPALSELRDLLQTSPDPSAAKLALDRMEREQTALQAAVSALPALESETASLERELLHFDDVNDGWWHTQLGKLVERLESLGDPRSGLINGVTPEHGWGIGQRRAFAASIGERSVKGDEARRRWKEALSSIADPHACPAYRGLVLQPQLGLLPLGPDPDSGLWEFAHLASGTPPTRGRDGKLVLTEETALVFVLLPGGKFWMGAQGNDPNLPNYDSLITPDDGPVHEATLSPFFMSRFEMTQGQWLRLSGKNPSADNPDTYDPEWSRTPQPGNLLHPVENVSWWECAQLLEQFGLVLPSEAQWEYGARGGRSTPWWSGADLMSLAGVANLHDSFAKERGRGQWGPATLELDDGFVSHAPVGSFAPNPFGLCDVHGNVFEWCLDGFGPSSSGQDPVSDPSSSPKRMFRGGGFSYDALFARVTMRVDQPPEAVNGAVGIRPARKVGP